MNELSLIEEINITQSIKMPHLMHEKIDAVAKISIAQSILVRKPEDIMLISSMGFETSSIIAGLSSQAIQYIATNAPLEYRRSIWSVIDNGAEVADILKIAKIMDDDRGSGSTAHQERVLNLIQYIKDNRIAFEF